MVGEGVKRQILQTYSGPSGTDFFTRVTTLRNLGLLVFESPEKDWPQAWKLGEEMIKQLRLDANV